MALVGRGPDSPVEVCFKTVNPSLSVAEVENAILNNVDPDTYLSGKVLTSGRVSRC
jgi:hypothetical protein